jgi:hypothetical protein
MISSLNGWYLGMLHHWICRKILHDIVAWSRSLLSGSNCTKSLGSAARWDVGTTPNRKLLVNWRLPIKKRMIRMVSSNSSIYMCVCRYLGDRWIGMDCPASKLLSRPRAGPWDFFFYHRNSTPCRWSSNVTFGFLEMAGILTTSHQATSWGVGSSFRTPDLVESCWEASSEHQESNQFHI